MAKSSLTGLLLAAVVGCSSPELKMLSEEQLAEKEQLTSLAEQLVGNNSGRPKLYDEEAIHSFLNRSLGLVLAIQENAFGITHDQIPEIAIQVIEFNLAGAYDPRTETIHLSPGADYIYGFRKALDHELGHFYTHQLAKLLAVEWNPFIMGNTRQQEIACRLISEGIAEYVSQTIHGQETTASGPWPRNVLNLDEKNIYDGGYNLVKPILELEFKTGVEYLLAHQPVNDLQDLQGYQIKAVEEVVKILSLKK